MRGLCLAMALASSAPAAAADARGAAFAAATLAVADANCPGVTADADALARASTAAGLHDGDGPALRVEAHRLRDEMIGAYDREPAGWCAAALDMFGPRGSIVPDLLRFAPSPPAGSAPSSGLY